MTLITKDHSIATRILDAKTSNKVLLAATREKSRIQLRTDSDCDERQLTGVIVSGENGELLVELNLSDHHAHAVLISPVLYASIEVADNRYVFKTRCLAANTDANGAVLRLTSPAAIAVVERRRAFRRRLHNPTDVILRASNPDAALHCTAVLLNLSADGMACRVGQSRTGSWAPAPGDTVCTTFNLGDEQERVDLTARVVTRTEAATPGNAILGMEFVEDGNLRINRSRLREACAEPG